MTNPTTTTVDTSIAKVSDIGSLTLRHHVSAVSSLEKSCHSLYGSSSFNSLIFSFLKVIETDFAPLDYGFYYRESSNLAIKSEWKPSKIEARFGTLNSQLCNKALEKIEQIGFDYESQSSMTMINVDNHELYSIRVFNLAGELCVLVWEFKTKDIGVSQKVLVDAKINFLVSQLSNELRWLSSLDETQALLYKDDLTGLYNHRYLDIAMESELKRGTRFGQRFCVLFMDLDGFKSVNDIHGHLSGSSVLKQVAGVLRHTLREVDVVIRYGGDEFVVMLIGADSKTGLLAGERIRKAIEEHQFIVENGDVIRLTTSIGIAAYPEHGKSKKELIDLADKLMYESKNSGKNKVKIFQTSIGNSSRNKSQIV